MMVLLYIRNLTWRNDDNDPRKQRLRHPDQCLHRRTGQSGRPGRAACGGHRERHATSARASIGENQHQFPRHQRGCVSANIHLSADVTRVVNYAQWDSAESYQSMLADPSAREHMATAAAMA